MSNLQLGLAALGAFILVTVVAYNAWVTRRSAPKRPDGHSTMPSGDSIAGRVEPGLDGPLLDGLMDSTLGAGPGRDARASSRNGGLDPLIDVVTSLLLDGPVSGDAVLAAMPGTRRLGSKPFAIEVQAHEGADWESPKPGQRYQGLQAGVQLANRHGALNEIEFSDFVLKVQALADAVGATTDFPDMRHEVQRARELDQFASTHDAQLGFTLRARRTAWSPGYVYQHATRMGFVPGALPGRMVLPGSETGAAPVLSLLFDTQAALAEDPEQSALREVSLLLDVAHVPRAERPYPHLREVAQALGQEMDGVLTDDRGQALAPETLDRIGTDLEQLYDALEARELAAGSSLARRLFS